MLGYGFWLRSTLPGWGFPVCVYGFRFFLHPAFLVGVFGHVPSCARPVRLLPPLGGAACGVGLCGDRRGRGFSPPPSFLFWLQGGRVLGRVLALCCSQPPVPVLGPLVSVPPSLFVSVASVFFLLLLPVARHSSSAVCAGVSGVPFPPALSAVVWSWWAAAFGSVWLGWAGWSSGVLSGGPVGVAFGVAWLGGVTCLLWSGCAALRLCDCLSPPPFLFPVGARSWLGGGPLPSVFYFGGRFTCSSLCLPWAGARTGRHSVWLTGGCWCCSWLQAVPRPHGSGGLCTSLAWRPVLSG